MIILISTRVSSWPRQFCGLKSNRRQAFLIRCSGLSALTSQRSGTYSSARGQKAALRCSVWWLHHTRQCSVMYCQPSGTTIKKSGWPARGAVTAGKIRSVSHMTAIM